MFNQMRQLPPDVVKEWDQGQPEFQPFQKDMRNVRLMHEARIQFFRFVWAGASLLIGFGAGVFAPALIGAIVLAVLVAVALIVQGVTWFRRHMVAMEISRKVDDGIKLVEPRKERAA